MGILNRLNKQNIDRAVSYLRRNGSSDFYYKVKERLMRDEDEADYSESVTAAALSEEEVSMQRRASFVHRYKISLIVPAYETNRRHIYEMMDSVLNQTYDNWELCIADGSVSDDVKDAVNDFILAHEGEVGERIKYTKLDENYGISGNSNKALSMATGEYVGLLDHDDILTRDALYEVVSHLQNGLYRDGDAYRNRIVCLYSDEDKVDDTLTKYFDYHRKPDFDIDLLCTNNYICHFFVARREHAVRYGFKDRYNGAQDHDFILRCVEKLKSDEICHIDKVLYHWRSSVNSTAENPDSKLYAYEAGKYAIEDHFKRLDIDVSVVPTKHLGFFRVKYKPLEGSVFTISKRKWDKITEKEIAAIKEELIMILGDDLSPESAHFRDEMSGYFRRAEVGCVGGKIIDSKSKVESAGFIRNENGDSVPCFKGLNSHYSGYLHRANLQRKVDAVAPDCMMVRKAALTKNKTLADDYIVVYTPYSVFKRM